MTPNENNEIYMPRKLPDLPVFGGHPEDWPIFYCAFTETTQTYSCTDLDNNQGLLKALNDEASETVKSLLTHPRNVDAVVDQMRFRYDTYLQPVDWYSSGIPFLENNLAKIVPFATRVSRSCGQTSYKQTSKTGQACWDDKTFPNLCGF